MLNAEGSPTALVPSSILLNMLVWNPRSMKARYSDPIPDPDSDPGSDIISPDPDPDTDSVENKT